jgi:hypothetical protein
LQKLPRLEVEEEANQSVLVDRVFGKCMAHLLQNVFYRVLAIGETAEQGGGVIETEAFVEVPGVENGAPVSKRLEPYAWSQGER